MPSYRDNRGERQPVCLGCMTRANAKRRELGLAAFEILADAYEPLPEAEL